MNQAFHGQATLRATHAKSIPTTDLFQESPLGVEMAKYRRAPDEQRNFTRAPPTSRASALSLAFG